MSKKMERMDMKITAGLLSIALLLIMARVKASILVINRAGLSSAGISINIDSCFQRRLESINFQLIDIAHFGLINNTSTLSPLTGDVVINTVSFQPDVVKHIYLHKSFSSLNRQQTIAPDSAISM